MNRRHWLALAMLLPLAAVGHADALIEAAGQGDVQALPRLLAAGADVNARAARGDAGHRSVRRPFSGSAYRATTGEALRRTGLDQERISRSRSCSA